MNNFIRTIKYLKNYKLKIFAAVICMAGYVIFSAFSITLIMPFLDAIFNKESTIINQYSAKPAQTEINTNSIIKKAETRIYNIRNFFIQKLNSMVTKRSKADTLSFLCFMLFIGFFFKNIFSFGQGFFTAFVEQGVMRDIRHDLFKHMQNISLDFYHKEKIGVLVSRATNDVNIINASVTSIINSFSRDPFLICIYLIIMFLMSWKLTLLSLLVVPFFGLTIAKVGNTIKKYSIRSQQRMADMASILIESLSGIRIVKAFTAENHTLNKFMEVAEKNKTAMIKRAWAVNISSPANEILGVGAGIFILWFGGNEVIKTQSGLTGGGFILFIFAMFSIIQPLKFLSQLWGSTKEGMSASERVFSILDVKPTITNSLDAVKIKTFSHEIRFNDLWFYYEKDQWVLKGINAVIPKGKLIALVGPSGAGKSTLVDMLIRFYDPKKGNISIDGKDLRNIEISSLRNLLGVVSQETILFHDTIKNNIAFGLNTVDDARIDMAAKAANAYDFIMAMPDKYETIIGDRGTKLSGGQRQRIAIARAILKDPPLLILDEATSSLDSESERLIQESMDRLVVNRTVLAIAHRLSTIQNADEIWVIDKGEIADKGRHKELLNKEGIYRYLYNLQFQKSE